MSDDPIRGRKSAPEIAEIIMDINETPAPGGPESSHAADFFDKTNENLDFAILDLLSSIFPEKRRDMNPEKAVRQRITDFPADLSFTSDESLAVLPEEHPWLHPPKRANVEVFSEADEKQSFYRQAKSFEFKEGSVSEEVPFFMYYPQYSAMTGAQSDWYFYWRSNIRQKIFIRTDSSYVFLYFYELIHMIGFTTPEEALEQMLFVWKEARYKCSLFDAYVVYWVRDFILYYGLELVYYDVIESILCEETGKYFYQECILYFLNSERKKGLMHALDECSTYHITESKYYKGEYGSLLEDAVCEVLLLWNKKHLEKKKMNLLSSLTEDVSGKTVIIPFSSALFYDCGSAVQNTEPHMNSMVRYSCLFKKIESDMIPQLHNVRKFQKFITGMLRTVEATMRLVTGYHRAIQKGVLPKSHMALIEKQTKAFYEEYLKDLKRKEKKVFSVNDGLLDKLKEDSLQIRRHLISEQEKSAGSGQDACIDADDDILLDEDPEIEDDSGSDGDSGSDVDSGLSVFESLVKSLSPGQVEILKVLCCNGQDQETVLKELRRIAALSNSFLNVIIEEINEAAVDQAGDCIIDTNAGLPTLYGDYFDEIKEILADGI
ncbi:MAG: TerB N-terminal domain-containing protein [Saccharofermentanales bacterium]